MEPIDNEFRELFSRQKALDRRRVPSFTVVVPSSSQVAPFRPALSRFRLAASLTIGLVLIVVTGMVASHLRHRSHEEEMRQWALLSEWTAATDGFLDHRALAGNESITDSFLGLQTQTPEPSSSPNQ